LQTRATTPMPMPARTNGEDERNRQDEQIRPDDGEQGVGQPWRLARRVKREPRVSGRDCGYAPRSSYVDPRVVDLFLDGHVATIAVRSPVAAAERAVLDLLAA
jgi:hypothetical protein